MAPRANIPRGKESGGGFSVELSGLDESLRILTKAGANVHGLDASNVRLANSTLRAQAQTLAERLARSTIVPLLLRGPAPQSPAMAGTVRAKADRMPIVRIGATNPRLSGFKRNPNNRRYRGSLAFGVERGAYPGSPDYYRLPRRVSGYVIGPNMETIRRAVLPDYGELVYLALRTAGVTSWKAA